MRLKLFFQLLKCLFKRWHESEFTLIITNNSDAVKNGALLGTNKNITAVNFGLDCEIDVSKMPIITYQEILFYLQSYPIILTGMTIQSENELQENIPFIIAQRDITRNEHRKKFLGSTKEEMIINGNTSIEVSILPKTTLLIKIKGKRIPSPLSMI